METFTSKVKGMLYKDILQLICAHCLMYQPINIYSSLRISPLVLGTLDSDIFNLQQLFEQNLSELIYSQLFFPRNSFVFK